MTVTPATLTDKQQEAVTFWQEYNVPAQWFVGELRPTGEVEVIALGDGFCWAFLIEADGQRCDSSEARLGEFETGVEI